MGPKLDTLLQIKSQKCRADSHHLPQHIAYLFATSLNILLIFLQMQLSVQLSIHLYKSTQMTHVQLVAYQDPRSFFAKLLSSHSAGMVHEVVLFQVLYLTFLHLLSFIRFLLDHISSLLRFLSTAELYFIRPKILLCLVSSAGFVRKYVPSYHHNC